MTAVTAGDGVIDTLERELIETIVLFGWKLKNDSRPMSRLIPLVQGSPI
jgi:hypothetical protein